MDGITGDQALNVLAQIRKKYVCSGEETDIFTAAINKLSEIVENDKIKVFPEAPKEPTKKGI